MQDKRSTPERFWCRVERTDGCWWWQGTLSGDGYGAIKINQRQHAAHRIAWELATGEPVPPDHQIGHTCDQPQCVRNDDAGTYTVDGIAYERHGHLWLATVATNAADMVAKGRSPRVSTPSFGDANGSRLHPERLVRGEQVNTAKLTTAQVIEIRRRRAAGERAAALAAEFGVHKNLIWLITSRRVWRHV